jgi:hypothetical protein
MCRQSNPSVGWQQCFSNIAGLMVPFKSHFMHCFFLNLAPYKYVYRKKHGKVFNLACLLVYSSLILFLNTKISLVPNETVKVQIIIVCFTCMFASLCLR